MQQLTVAVLDDFHARIVETIEAALPDSWLLRRAASKRPQDQADALAEAEIAFVMAAPMPADLLRSAGRLRFIQKLGAGVDRIDTDYCAAQGIAVARLQAGNAIPVAEHTLMLILSAYRRLPILDWQTRAGNWDKEESRGINRQIHGKRVGIVGFGAIGRTLAKLLSGFDAEIVYYDPVRAPEDVERALNARFLSLDELIPTADIVSLHLPLTKETAGLMDARRVAAMKSGALLVNCARGGLIDEAALVQALEQEHLFGAALDAFSQEPPLGSPLLQLQNTVVTPHAAGATLDNFAQIAARAVANAERFLAGESLPSGDIVVAPPSTAAA